MNNRQKAKHWKQLYEGILKEPKPVKIDYSPLVHYHANCEIPMTDIAIASNDRVLTERIIMSQIMNELMPLVKKNIICQRRDEIDALVYSIDLWMKGENK